MAKKKKKQKKKEHKPKLRLVRATTEETNENPPKPTIEDIEHAVDEIILGDDTIMTQVIANAINRHKMKPETAQRKVERSKVVVKVHSESSIFDFISAEETMINCPNLESEDFVWVLFYCYCDEQRGNLFGPISVHTKQVRAINRCFWEMQSLLISAEKTGDDKVDIHINKQ